ncbi:MAG: DUF790 family protein [Promethearchaeia archaeon]
MFPKSLLNIARRRGTIYPQYLKTLEDHKIIDEVLSIFKSFKGKKRSTLKKKIRELENQVNDYKVVRGLSRLLERRSTFESPFTIESEEIRSFLFDHGFAKTEKLRRSILEQAGKYFDMPPSHIEKAMFADLPKEQILTHYDLPTSDELLKLYNVSLTQTLLLNSLSLTLILDSNFQQVFRFINYLGLMYELKGSSIHITGPLSIFRKTRKYGTQIAKLFPIILQSSEWKLKAEIELKWGSEAKIYEFSLTSETEIPFTNHNHTAQIEPFDSQVEKRFYEKFQNFKTGWEIRREPKFVKTGSFVTIPDFGFYKHDMEILMEVVGFWTPEYLEKKREKLNKAEQQIIAVVDQKLNCTREDFPGDVIFYKKEIPIKPILNILQRAEAQYIKKEVKALDNLDLNKEIILIKEKAQELGVSLETLQSIDVDNYVLIGDKLISNNFLNKLKHEIGSKREYGKIKQILEKYEISNSVLTEIGFKIIWEGLRPIRIVKA